MADAAARGHAELSPLTVELQSLAPPPEPERDVAPGPTRVERQEARPQPDREIPPQPMVVLVTAPANEPLASEPVEIVNPGPPMPQTTAPKAIAAPAALRLSSDTRPDWEASVLAHLGRFRRYPALPAIHAGRPDTVELTVPIEFDLR